MSTRFEPSPDAAGGVLYPLAVCLLVVGLLVGIALLPRVFTGHDPPFVGKAAPDLTFPVVANAERLPKGADGQAMTNLPVSALKGKVVSLDFWATWCGPCNIEAPILDQVGKKYDDKGLVVVGVSQDQDPNFPRVWTRQKKISYPMVFDDSNGSSRFDVDGLPTMVVLDRGGVVRAVRVGVTQKSELEDLVEKYL